MTADDPLRSRDGLGRRQDTKSAVAERENDLIAGADAEDASQSGRDDESTVGVDSRSKGGSPASRGHLVLRSCCTPDERLDRPVAPKMLEVAANDATARERMRREARAGRLGFSGGIPVEIFHPVAYERPPALAGGGRLLGVTT